MSSLHIKELFITFKLGILTGNFIKIKRFLEIVATSFTLH